MNITVSLTEKESLPAAAALGVSHVLISDGSFSSGNIFMTREEIRDFIACAHDNGLRVIVRTDRLYDEGELEALADHLRFLNGCRADGLLISDLAVWMLKKREQLDLDCLYGPEPLLCSSREIAQLRRDGLEGCLISKEVPFEGIGRIAQENEDYCWLRIYGPLLLSYSKRRFISLYLNDEGEHLDDYQLQEETREMRMPIIERMEGSWLYGPTLHSLERISQISSLPLRGIILDDIFTADEDILNVLKLHLEVLNGEISEQQAIGRLHDLDKNRTCVSIADIRATVVNKEEA